MKLNFPEGVTHFFDSTGKVFQNVEGFIEVELNQVEEFLKAKFTHAQPPTGENDGQA